MYLYLYWTHIHGLKQRMQFGVEAPLEAKDVKLEKAKTNLDVLTLRCTSIYFSNYMYKVTLINNIVYFYLNPIL